jgi:RNA polymerase sigma-70 factor (ECF subfamily)
MTDLSNEDLARAAQSGDKHSFEVLVSRLERPVFGLCRLMLRDVHEASDATQEAFLRAYRSLERYDPARRFSTWLMTIASRICHDMREKKRPHPTGDALTDHIGEPHDPSAILSTREDVRRVRAAIELLPDRERDAIALFVEKGLGASEVAEILGVTTGHLGVILFRAKGRLRQILKENSGPGV